MLRVVETFSGIGSQFKALKNIGAEVEVLATVEWDLNAIYAYDIIHNGKPNLENYISLNKKRLIEILMEHTISNDGKKPLGIGTLKVMSEDSLRRIVASIDRTKNLVSITEVKATDLPENIDLLTYSFPCQDLSICGSWHGNKSGIDRAANNRSGMLWEVERILKEHVEIDKVLPKFLLMENVSNILSDAHKHNFEEWKQYLSDIGYVNQIYTLNALNFGIPQKRVRTYMLSVQFKNNQEKGLITQYFSENNLEDHKNTPLPSLLEYLRVDYANSQYKKEADISNPNYTPSREKIFKENDIIFDGKKVNCTAIKTITTKQDRNPNSGLLLYQSDKEGKSPYRNLTPRECFLLMGFDEEDFNSLIANNILIKKNRPIFVREKLVKMAGNSIVVKVLEEIFKQVIYINENIMN